MDVQILRNNYSFQCLDVPAIIPSNAPHVNTLLGLVTGRQGLIFLNVSNGVCSPLTIRIDAQADIYVRTLTMVRSSDLRDLKDYFQAFMNMPNASSTTTRVLSQSPLLGTAKHRPRDAIPISNHHHNRTPAIAPPKCPSSKCEAYHDIYGSSLFPHGSSCSADRP